MADNPVINIADVEPMTFGNGGRFEGSYRWLSRQSGARKLGYNHVTLAPGKTAFPYHFHRGLEEAFVVLKGSGLLRYGGDEYPLRPGDVVACPPGPESAHQISNDGEEDLEYLAISTMQLPDIVQYPDSGKMLVTGERDPNAAPDEPPFRLIVKDDVDVDYWDGEE